MKIGLILSGGGARGFAHLGALQAFDELGIPIDAIAGTSAGAIAGALYLSGFKPMEGMQLIRSFKTYEWMRPLWRKPGLLNMEKIGSLLSKYLPDNFEKIPRPLIVCATDILNCESVYFSSGPLIPAITASAAIPVMFEPLKIDGKQYVDGGILDNFPVEQLRERCEKIIGIHVNPIERGIPHVHFKDIMDRSLHLALSWQIESKKKDCDVFIEPISCSHYGLLDLPDAERIFEIGYYEVMGRGDEIIAALQ